MLKKGHNCGGDEALQEVDQKVQFGLHSQRLCEGQETAVWHHTGCAVEAVETYGTQQVAVRLQVSYQLDNAAQPEGGHDGCIWWEYMPKVAMGRYVVEQSSTLFWQAIQQLIFLPVPAKLEAVVNQEWKLVCQV